MMITIDGIDHLVDYNARFFGVAWNLSFREVVAQDTRPPQGSLIDPSFDDIAFVVVHEPSSTALMLLGLMALTRADRRSHLCARDLRQRPF